MGSLLLQIPHYEHRSNNTGERQTPQKVEIMVVLFDTRTELFAEIVFVDAEEVGEFFGPVPGAVESL